MKTVDGVEVVAGWYFAIIDGNIWNVGVYSDLSVYRADCDDSELGDSEKERVRRSIYGKTVTLDLYSYAENAVVDLCDEISADLSKELTQNSRDLQALDNLFQRNLRNSW